MIGAMNGTFDFNSVAFLLLPVKKWHLWVDVTGSWMVCAWWTSCCSLLQSVPWRDCLINYTHQRITSTALPTSTSSTSSCSTQGTSCLHESYRNSTSDETLYSRYLGFLAFRKNWTSNGLQNISEPRLLYSRNQWFSKLEIDALCHYP